MFDFDPIKPDEIELGGMLLWQGMPRDELEDKILTLLACAALTYTQAKFLLGIGPEEEHV